jgi:error-prone DNA polymerase
LSLRAHPISFFRADLAHLGVTAAAELANVPNNRRVRVAGLVLLRQRPSTAKGITFVTLEDETGATNLVIRHGVWQRYHQTAQSAAAFLAHGRLETKAGVIHVVVDRLENLTEKLKGLHIRSRDFR